MQTTLNLETESEKKANILNNLENNHPAFLEEARRIARHCCHANLGLRLWNTPHTVNSDYIREQMYIERVPDDRHKVMGSVFRKGFIRVGFMSSGAEGSHGRVIGLWTIEKYIEVVRKYKKED